MYVEFYQATVVLVLYLLKIKLYQYNKCMVNAREVVDNSTVLRKNLYWIFDSCRKKKLGVSLIRFSAIGRH